MDGKSLKVCIASDHAGFLLKENVRKYLTEQGYNVTDLGTCSEESVDYTEYARKAALAVSGGEYDRGIIICGTGIGVSIVANKTKGIRAALCTDQYMAKMCREHNNANVICMGARVIGFGVARDIAVEFLNHDFEEGGRHQVRVDKINAMDKA
ncbi:MAG: ribose 5-phosphate isomerase B [Abditibacteriota bacterium]|nr:ribose 5-phosphate isomerase B [Abditibacteriota bacterium]